MGASCCGGPGPDVTALHAAQRRVLWTALVVNAATFVMVVAASWWSGSSALLSGGLDNLGDAVTYALSLTVVGATGVAKARVALFKAALILAAAIGVGVQIVWHAVHPGTPLFETMGLAALANLAANAVCLALLSPYRHGDINMASAWECSRNDVVEGLAVIAAAVGVGVFRAGWPDRVVAACLLFVFLRSAWRVFRHALTELKKGD